MRSSRRSMLAAVIGLAALAFATCTASANRVIGVSETRTTPTSTALTFTEEGGGFNIICEVTLTITLNRSIGKTRGNTVGGVTGVTIRNCRGGTVRVLAPEAARPWPVKYESFSGTLPNITSVRLTLERVGFLVEAFFGIARCLYGGNAQGTTGPNTTVRELRADERVALPLSRNLGGAECPRNGIFRGTFNVFPEVRLTLDESGEEVECRTPPTVVSQIRATGTGFSETPTVTMNCNRTRINSIGTGRPEVIAITDREGAIGREFRRGQAFRYDVIGRNQPGTGEYTDQITIGTNYGNAITRVIFNDNG